MLTDTIWREREMEYRRSLLENGSTWELWYDITIPNEATGSTGNATQLAGGELTPEMFSADPGSMQIVIGVFADNAVRASGVPTFFRMKNPEGSYQLTARMASGVGTADIVVNDVGDDAAESIKRGSVISFTVILQF